MRRPSRALLGQRPPGGFISLPTVEEAQRALDEHLARRPDHLKALHPNAPKALRDDFSIWCAQHERLKAVLSMAKSAATAGWRDQEGNRTNPLPWAPGPGQTPSRIVYTPRRKGKP